MLISLDFIDKFIHDFVHYYCYC